MSTEAMKQAQEPVAKIEQAERDLIPQDKLFVSGQLGANVTRVRKERKWQGLTDDELDAMRQEAKLDFVTLREFRIVARAVEAKLKERNG